MLVNPALLLTFSHINSVYVYLTGKLPGVRVFACRVILLDFDMQ